MNELKMILIETGAGMKKILGRLEYIDGPSDCYTFSEAIMIEDAMTEKGIESFMIPLAPKAQDAAFNFDKKFVIIHPFTPSKAACDMFTRATSSLVIPSPSVTQ